MVDAPRFSMPMLIRSRRHEGHNGRRHKYSDPYQDIPGKVAVRDFRDSNDVPARRPLNHFRDVGHLPVAIEDPIF
jgi:hypothetical protein